MEFKDYGKDTSDCPRATVRQVKYMSDLQEQHEPLAKIRTFTEEEFRNFTKDETVSYICFANSIQHGAEDAYHHMKKLHMELFGVPYERSEWSLSAENTIALETFLQLVSDRRYLLEKVGIQVTLSGTQEG